MTQSKVPNRCRLVLVTPLEGGAEAIAAQVQAALSGGDVASVILAAGSRDAEEYQVLAERVIPIAQQAGAAAIVEQDSRVAGRTGADGLHLDLSKDDLREAIERADGKIAIGAGGIKTRDQALELGEVGPDYVFFGRFGYDDTEEPHPRNLGLARWWAEMIEIPCLVLGGTTVTSAGAVAATGAEFVALSAAVFASDDAAEAVREVNALLDEEAPRFSGAGNG